MTKGCGQALSKPHTITGREGASAPLPELCIEGQNCTLKEVSERNTLWVHLEESHRAEKQGTKQELLSTSGQKLERNLTITIITLP